jgi:hypothetical protein
VLPTPVGQKRASGRSPSAGDRCQTAAAGLRAEQGDQISLRCGRLPTGERVGIAFTETGLIKVMGRDQAWIRLSDGAMKTMLAPLGIRRIQVDPELASATFSMSLSA